MAVTRRLLLSASIWLHASLAASQSTVEVKPGANVTLSCTNVSSSPTLAFWMKARNTSMPIVISSVYGTPRDTGRRVDVNQGKFEMEYSVSFINLTITQVNSLDSGMYYCIFYHGVSVVVGNSSLLSVGGNATLHEENSTICETTQPEICDGNWMMVGGIFGSVIMILVLIIVALVIKITQQCQIQKDTNQPQLQESQSHESDQDEICYSTLIFRQLSLLGLRHKRKTREETEETVVYTTTR